MHSPDAGPSCTATGLRSHHAWNSQHCSLPPSLPPSLHFSLPSLLTLPPFYPPFSVFYPPPLRGSTYFCVVFPQSCEAFSLQPGSIQFFPPLEVNQLLVINLCPPTQRCSFNTGCDKREGGQAVPGSAPEPLRSPLCCPVPSDMGSCRLPAALLAAALTSLLPTPAAPSAPRKLLLFLLDGFRFDYIDDSELEGLPGFRDIVNMGVKVDYMTPDFPSLSYPNYYTLMTGEYLHFCAVMLLRAPSSL